MTEKNRSLCPAKGCADHIPLPSKVALPCGPLLKSGHERINNQNDLRGVMRKNYIRGKMISGPVEILDIFL